MSDDLMAFLESAGAGCISGRVSEWPQLKPACKWAAQEIKRHRRIEDGAVMPLIEAVRKAKEARFNKDAGDLFDCLDTVFRELAAIDAVRKEQP